MGSNPTNGELDGCQFTLYLVNNCKSLHCDLQDSSTEKPPVTTVFVGNISDRAPDSMIKQMLQVSLQILAISYPIQTLHITLDVENLALYWQPLSYTENFLTIPGLVCPLDHCNTHS